MRAGASGETAHFGGSVAFGCPDRDGRVHQGAGAVVDPWAHQRKRVAVFAAFDEHEVAVRSAAEAGVSEQANDLPLGDELAGHH